MSDTNNLWSVLENIEKEVDGWLSAEELMTLRRTEGSKGTIDEFWRCILQAYRRGLDPFTGHVYFDARFDRDKNRETLDLGIKIDGLRVIAERSGQYAGQKGPFWCGADGKWQNVWLSDDSPLAAKVGILRKDFDEPLWAIARWSDYVSTTRKGEPTYMWKQMGPHMLAKSAEALGLRKAFPQQSGGLYTKQEMGSSDTGRPSDDAPEPKPDHGPPTSTPAAPSSKPPTSDGAPPTQDASDSPEIDEDPQEGAGPTSKQETGGGQAEGDTEKASGDDSLPETVEMYGIVIPTSQARYIHLVQEKIDESYNQGDVEGVLQKVKDARGYFDQFPEKARRCGSMLLDRYEEWARTEMAERDGSPSDQTGEEEDRSAADPSPEGTWGSDAEWTDLVTPSGELTDSFPHASVLLSHEPVIETYNHLREFSEDWTEIDGIGGSYAKEIDEAFRAIKSGLAEQEHNPFEEPAEPAESTEAFEDGLEDPELPFGN
jgi:phage recombination protein Bet